jgi:hypothetical protein
MALIACSSHTLKTLASSQATTTALALESFARAATLTIIGKPLMSASGLLGKRDDAKRAGMMTVKGKGD